MDAAPLELALCSTFKDEPVLDCTIGGLLRDAARDYPDHDALVEGRMDGTAGRRWTFAQLLAEAETLAGALAARYEKGERVAVWAPNVPEWVVLEYAVALAGLTLVTVNPAFQARELDYVLRHSRASGLFLVKEFRGNPMADIAAKVAGDLPDLREIVDLQDKASMLGDKTAPLPEVGTHDPAQIQFTSGTTGFPKGVLLSHRNLANNARFFVTTAQVAEYEPFLGLTPLFHTMGCAMAVLGALQLHAPYIPLLAFDPAAAVKLIAAEKVSGTICVPVMAQALIEAQKALNCDLSSLRVIGVGGAMVAPELAKAVQDVLGAKVLVAYGQTESSPLITSGRPDDSFEDISTTVGRPCLGCEVGIFDPATNEVVPVDVVGEVRSRSYATMLGYDNDPEATAETIDKNGWLLTGDLGTMDERGYVKITGRVKEMIIRGGENLFPAEIENVLMEHPDVAEAAIVGVPDAKWGEAVAAFIRPVAGAQMDAESLTAHCRAQLSGPKCPAHWTQVESWPLTGSGKIQKFALRDQWVKDAAAN